MFQTGMKSLPELRNERAILHRVGLSIERSLFKRDGFLIPHLGDAFRDLVLLTSLDGYRGRHCEPDDINTRSAVELAARCLDLIAGGVQPSISAIGDLRRLKALNEQVANFQFRVAENTERFETVSVQP